MRPKVLFPLFKSIKSLKGVGQRIGRRIEVLSGPNIIDTLWHLPNEIIDRRYSPDVVDAKPGLIGSIIVKVCEHIPPPNKRIPYKIKCSDGTGVLMLVFFKAHRSYLLDMLPVGSQRGISGKFEKFGNQLQITHPDYIVGCNEINNLRRLEPTYPLTSGLTAKSFRKVIETALEFVPQLSEWIDPQLKLENNWPPWHQAILAIHRPENKKILDPESPVRMRLAYDELLANQISLALSRQRIRAVRGRSFKGNGTLVDQVITNLPYKLTASQENALSEINHDLESELRMLRLLQGDVGSGKTILALLAMLKVIESGAQAAIMAPTEILADQHFSNILQTIKPGGLEVVLLTGRSKGQSRDETLQRLTSGKPLLVVGTHALFQKDVEFKNLGMAVIDEQHRFGVHQRLDLSSKGLNVEILAMTATPIPRTLTLTAYGDMDVSFLTEKPAGRHPIDTRAIPLERFDEVVEAVGRATQEGAKVYWVCPLIEESQVMDLSATEERFDSLNLLFPGRVGILHGRMVDKEKEAVLKDFSLGSLDILVTTTVIEVGLDVANASVMVIDHAERFGLAQLHQLRGRVGRGSKVSTCILLYSSSLSETAHARLSIMRETNDGFKIAEKDLKLRGAGELLGVRQSGLPVCRLANLGFHEKLLELAKRDASNIISRDPQLRSERGRNLRTLLYLFNQNEVSKILRSG